MTNETEAVQRPLKLIQRLFAERSPEADGDFVVEKHFTGLLQSEAKVDMLKKSELALVAIPSMIFAVTLTRALACDVPQIPILNASTIDHLPNNSLVRFRGMVSSSNYFVSMNEKYAHTFTPLCHRFPRYFISQIQDMLNPEYYVGEYRRSDGSWQTAKYHDELDEVIRPGTETKFAERKPLVIVPIPGEASWITDRIAQEAVSFISPDGNGVVNTTSSTPKRPHSATIADAAEQMSLSIGVSDATGMTDAAADDDGDSTASARRRAVVKQHRSAGDPLSENAAEAPNAVPVCSFLPGSVLVCVYDNDEALKLNDVVDVVGVLSKVPELASMHLAASDDGALSLLDQDALSAHPPTSQLPRVHAILVHKEARVTQALEFLGKPVDIASARARAAGFLSMILGGDDLAAEYLLLQTLSRVHLRTKEAGALGTMPLSVTGCPAADFPSSSNTKSGCLSGFGDAVTAAVSALTPRCIGLPLSIAALNKGLWTPRRVEGSAYLTPGPLQMAPGTHMIVDETLLEAGTLNETGLRNLAAIQGMMRVQKIAYDFQYFTLDQPTDAPVTILSTGRSILKGAGELEVPLRPTAPLASGTEAVVEAVRSGDVIPARTYMAAVRHLEFSIPESVASAIERELAVAKQKDAAVTEETFHAWLNVARLLALSYGEEMLTMERWAHAMKLECRRRERIVVART